MSLAVGVIAVSRACSAARLKGECGAVPFTHTCASTTMVFELVEQRSIKRLRSAAGCRLGVRQSNLSPRCARVATARSAYITCALQSAISVEIEPPARSQSTPCYLNSRRSSARANNECATPVVTAIQIQAWPGRCPCGNSAGQGNQTRSDLKMCSVDASQSVHKACLWIVGKQEVSCSMCALESGTRIQVRTGGTRTY
jgi:hypothetical protein